MPVKSVFCADIENVSILDEHGNFDESLGRDLIPLDDVVALYEHISICREYDQVAFKLQRSGRMSTYPQNWGQEATSAGAAYVMRKQDWLVPCYRENAGMFWRGLPMEYIYWHWMGDERGNQIPEGLRILPIAVPIGTQMLHACGLAWASKLRGEDAVAVTFFGEGATSEGDFHEAMNFATTLRLPVIFFCQNNNWAISTPRQRNVAAPTVAQRGLAYGAHCVQCDGNDLFAVVKVMKDALVRAREHSTSPGTPVPGTNDTPVPGTAEQSSTTDSLVTFIEGVTYRMGDHTTADDARRYRDSAEVEGWAKRDPLVRLRRYLESQGAWNDAKQEALQQRAKAHVAEVVKRAEGIEKPTIDDIFNHTFAELPPSLIEQRDTLRTASLTIAAQLAPGQ